MEITVSVSAHTDAELAANLRRIADKLAPPATSAAAPAPPADDTDTPDDEKPRRGRPKGSKNKRKDPAPAPAPAPETKPEPPADEPKAVTRDDLRSAIEKAIGAHGEPPVKEVFAKHKAKKFSDIDESKYAAVLADLRTLDEMAADTTVLD